MIIIELLGNCSKIFSQIKNFLKDKNPSVIEKGEITFDSNDYIISDSKIPIFTEKKKIIVFCGGNYKKNILIPQNSICICKSDDKKALNKLINTDVTVITCGMQKNDTVTFSSLENEFLISLQREITDFKGKTIEPLEFPSIFKDKDSTSLLLLNTVALITDSLAKNI